MLKNTVINRKATVKIARALGELNGQVVFVGGAMVSLYIRKILANEQIMNAMPGHLYFDGIDERMEIIIGKMNAIVRGSYT
ncbi:MAG: hypothetical protein ACKV1O_01960 [Saprospiraceae bacterium]